MSEAEITTLPVKRDAKGQYVKGTPNPNPSSPITPERSQEMHAKRWDPERLAREEAQKAEIRERYFIGVTMGLAKMVKESAGTFGLDLDHMSDEAVLAFVLTHRKEIETQIALAESSPDAPDETVEAGADATVRLKAALADRRVRLLAEAGEDAG